ncbi:MAG: maleylpyruvate isomerase N-terminal domain-containing protein [Chloroflexi bacterium]|nr:maleylpyruvate isomerase N-terminal domain-containing protein [Chloroflexota bacterium]
MTTREELIDGFRMIIREGQRTTGDFAPGHWTTRVHDEEDGWNVKQIYAHLTAVAEVTPGLLGALANADEERPPDAETTPVAARAELSPEELMQAFESAFQKLIEFVQTMPEEHLEMRRKFGEVEGQVADIMSSVIVLHGLAHIYLASTRAFV